MFEPIGCWCQQKDNEVSYLVSSDLTLHSRDWTGLYRVSSSSPHHHQLHLHSHLIHHHHIHHHLHYLPIHCHQHHLYHHLHHIHHYHLHHHLHHHNLHHHHLHHHLHQTPIPGAIYCFYFCLLCDYTLMMMMMMMMMMMTMIVGWLQELDGLRDVRLGVQKG